MPVPLPLTLYTPLSWNTFPSSLLMLFPSQPSYHLLQEALLDLSTHAQLGSPSEISTITLGSSPTCPHLVTHPNLLLAPGSLEPTCSFCILRTTCTSAQLITNIQETLSNGR